MPATPDDSEFRERAERHLQQLPTELRKRRGAWYTPRELADPTAARTLLPLLRTPGDRPLRIVDPAVGGGAFLLAALRQLLAAGLPGATAAECLHGLDLDAASVQLAVDAVAAVAGITPDRLAARIRVGDGLRELEPGSFDAVLTNPPWETLQSGATAAADCAALRPHFAHQGRGKLYTYRLFVERAFQLLRPGGRLGLIVPASLWFDRDAEPLRRLLLDQCRWEWLYGFENRAGVFRIDRRYRFGVVIAEKGARTERLQAAFGRTAIADWAAPVPPHVDYSLAELRTLSPGSGALVEVEHRRDLDVLQTMAAHGVPLLGARGAFTWRQGDFNMTADRDRFVLREQAERDGYRADDDAVWRRQGHPDLLPLYQGAMIGELHPNAGAHVSGTGRRTAWGPVPAAHELRPAYLVAAAPWRAAAHQRSAFRLVHRALSNATNERTTIACLLPDQPTGNSLGALSPRPHDPRPLHTLAAAAAVLASLPFDWALRQRLGGTNLNGFVLADCLLPRLDDGLATELAGLALCQNAILPWHEALWQQAAAEGFGAGGNPARTASSRAAIATRIDLLVGRAFGLDAAAVQWLTRGCEDDAAGQPRPAKGFWRIDRDQSPATRRPLRWRDAALTGT